MVANLLSVRMLLTVNGRSLTALTKVYKYPVSLRHISIADISPKLNVIDSYSRECVYRFAPRDDYAGSVTSLLSPVRLIWDEKTEKMENEVSSICNF